MSEARAFYKPDSIEQEGFTLLDIQAEQDRILRETGIADKAIAVLRQNRADYEKAHEELGGNKPFLDRTPDLDDPNVTATVALVRQKYDMGKGDVFFLEQPSVVFFTAAYDRRGLGYRMKRAPVTVTKVFEGAPFVMPEFDEENHAVLAGLIEAVQLAREHDVLPNVSADLLSIESPVEAH